MKHILKTRLQILCPGSLRKHSTALLSLLLCMTGVSLYIYITHPRVHVYKAIMGGMTLNSSRIIYQYYSEGDYIPSQPLLVLFTTFKVNEDNAHIYRNTLRNWGLLQPAVQPVLFHDDLDQEWLLLAQGLGWATMRVPEKLDEKLPFLKPMYEAIFREFQGEYYAYANADILFDESLILTLWTLQQRRTKNLFLVGRRTNFPVTPDIELRNLADVRKMGSTSNAKLFIHNAQDYFITTRGSFNWDKIPNFVVGRPAYDNWLVQYALRRYNKVIDATNSILALHQTGADGNLAGSHHPYKPNVNFELVGMKFDYSLGSIDCATWETYFNETRGGVQLRLRNPNPCARLLAKSGVDWLGSNV